LIILLVVNFKGSSRICNELLLIQFTTLKYNKLEKVAISDALSLEAANPGTPAVIFWF